jgi:hypothetical protein
LVQGSHSPQLWRGLTLDAGATIDNDTRVFRNRTNHIAGIVMQFILVTLWVLGDPPNRRGDQAADDRLGPALAAMVTFLLGAAAVTSLAIWWYPRVELDPNSLTILNPVRTIVIPRDHIQNIDESGFLVRIEADGHSYRCAGLETSLAMMMSGDPNSSTGRIVATVRPPSRDDEATPVHLERRHPTALERSPSAPPGCSLLSRHRSSPDDVSASSRRQRTLRSG